MITVSPLMEERASEKARQADLEEARAIQDAMLPSEALTAGAVTVTHKFQPVDAVGGDFLDYFRLADESVGMYLGDVCGKGLPAAMYGALAVGILRGVHKTGQPPHTILSTLNSRLTGRAGMRRHVAVAYGMFDPRTLEMQISSAGMPAVLHFTEEEYRTVELTGIPPGLFAHAEYETATVQLHPGDSILMCSDGIVEAQNARYEDFGVERLLKVCQLARGSSPAELLGRIFEAVHEFTHVIQQHDDMAATLFHLGHVKGD